jgi:hypothetical protein
MEIFEFHKVQDAQKDDIEVLDKQKQEFKLIGRAKKVPGHTMFSYNWKTGEIKVADIQQCGNVDYMTRQLHGNARIVIEKNCIYRQALNRKNFIKRLIREGVPVKEEEPRR